ncbi:MAG: nucleoside triphosphate pyrophosphohydrolase [Longimicrobiales bacterium]
MGTSGEREQGPEQAPDAGALERVARLVAFLRANCDWDAAQTPRSLTPYLLEEAHETVDAIEDGDDEHLRVELGDLLLNIAFQIVLAGERGAFSADDVVHAVERKMRRRHPHLYGTGDAEPWETLKARERGSRSVLHGLARGLEPLSRAHRIQDRVSGVGFDWADPAGALDKVREETDEVAHALVDGGDRLEEELGDLLFAVVNLARLAGVHPLHALGGANRKFERRFRDLERLAAERGIDLGSAGLERLDVLWDEVKRLRPPAAD